MSDENGIEHKPCFGDDFAEHLRDFRRWTEETVRIREGVSHMREYTHHLACLEDIKDELKLMRTSASKSALWNLVLIAFITFLAFGGGNIHWKGNEAHLETSAHADTR